jgi:predicted RND superfamily exporter protein
LYSLTRFALASPRSTLGAIAALSVAFAVGAAQVGTDAGYRAYMGEAHPSVLRLDSFVARFGGGLPIAAVYRCGGLAPCDDVFDPTALEMARTVAQRLDGVIGVSAIATPATSPLLVPTRDGLEVVRAIDRVSDARARSALRDRALQDPLWSGVLISADAKVGAIAIELDSSESRIGVEVLRTLRGALAPFEDQGFSFHLVGDPVAFVVAGADLQADSIALVPAIVVLIAVVLSVLFGNVRMTAAALASVGVAVVWTFGAMGWLGWPQTAVTQALAPFVLVVGVCNAIHILARYVRMDGGDRVARERALIEVVGDVGPACWIASATTAGGFASFATSGAVSFVHFGLLAAFGVISSYGLSFTLLILLLRRIDPSDGRAPVGNRAWDAALEHLVRSAQSRHRLVLVGAAALALLGAGGASALRAEVDVHHMFGEQTRVVRWIRFVEENLRRAFTLELAVEIPAGRRVEEPEILGRVADLSARLAAVDGLGEPRSLLDPLSRLNRLIHDDDPEFEHPAGREEVNAELLLLLTMQDPAALDRWLSLDHRSLRVAITAEAASSSDGAGVLEEVERIVSSLGPEGWKVEITGPLRVHLDMVNEVQTTQLRSFVTALIAVLALVCVFLRSLPWALAAMVPTLLPVVTTLGAMGYWGIRLDMGTAMVAAVVLGIAVDDTVHLLVQIRRHRAAGEGADRAVEAAVAHVGRAVVTTSIALALGFFVLTLSSWESVASFGVLSGLAILGAMVSDLVVLPALVSAVVDHDSLTSQALLRCSVRE